MKRSKRTMLRLRPVERPDVDLFYRWNTEEVLGRWQGCRFVSLSECLRRFEAGEFCNDKLQLLVIDVGRPVGFFTIKFVRTGLAEIGIALTSKMRRRGFAQAALLQALDYIFANYQVERVQADTDIENVTARIPLTNAGFKREGVLRKYRFHHGIYHDSEIYSLLREEWLRKGGD